MTETESLIAEVRQLRVEVARLHAAHTAVHIRHGWMKPLFKDLSTNPYTQYKVHMWGAIYWLINFPLICCLFFFTPTLWLKLGIFITLIYSIYANLATDYGAMSAAEAAFGKPQPPPIHLSRRPSYSSPRHARGGRRSGQVRSAWKRPAATGATGPPTHSRPSGPGRTSIVLGRPVNRPWWTKMGSLAGRTPWCSR